MVGEELVVELCLPCSKQDNQGCGVARRVRCSCGLSRDYANNLGTGGFHTESLCAAHALLWAAAFVAEEAGVMPGARGSERIPLFPTREGEVATGDL